MESGSVIQEWIYDAQRQIDKYKKIISDCDRQIARLEPVYRELGEIKSDFSSIRKSTEEIFEEKGEWNGEKYIAFCRSGNILDNHCDSYFKKLDAAQDAINEKIGELRAKKLELIPIIGKLSGEITRWRVDIENARN